MSRWQDSVAVVTGASSGIGAAVVEVFVEKGLKVVGLARRKEKIEELAKKLNDKPGKVYAVKADVTKEDDIFAAFDWVTKNVGPVSILVNNAGLARNTTIVDGNINDWKDILNTNVLGLTIATREAIKIMRENKIDGHIVNMNSVVGHHVPVLPNQNLYPASKHAVTAFTETLRLDLVKLGSKIRVSSISPGCVKTEIFATNGFLENEETKKLLEIVPQLKAEDVADAVWYAVNAPAHVQITELTLKPVGEFV